MHNVQAPWGIPFFKKRSEMRVQQPSLLWALRWLQEQLPTPITAREPVVAPQVLIPANTLLVIQHVATTIPIS